MIQYLQNIRGHFSPEMCLSQLQLKTGMPDNLDCNCIQQRCSCRFPVCFRNCCSDTKWDKPVCLKSRIHHQKAMNTAFFNGVIILDYSRCGGDYIAGVPPDRTFMEWWNISVRIQANEAGLKPPAATGSLGQAWIERLVSGCYSL